MTRNRMARRVAWYGCAALVFASAIKPTHAEETGVLGVFKEFYDSLSIGTLVAKENDPFLAEAKELRRKRRAELSDIAELAGADEACQGKLLHEMAPFCWDVIENHIGEVQVEMDQLLRDIAREKSESD